MIVLDLNPVDFIPESEKNEEKPATFQIRALSASQLDAILVGQSMSSESDFNTILMEKSTAILKDGLVNWSGLVNKDGKEVRFNVNNPRKSLDILPLFVRVEIAGQIFSMSVATTTEEKKVD